MLFLGFFLYGTLHLLELGDNFLPCAVFTTSADPLRSGPKTAVVMYLDLLWKLEEKQSCPVPVCTCYMPTMPTAAKAGPIPAVRAIVSLLIFF